MSRAPSVDELARHYAVPAYIRQVDRYGNPLTPWFPFGDRADGDLHFRQPIGDREDDLPDWRDRQ